MRRLFLPLAAALLCLSACEASTPAPVHATLDAALQADATSGSDAEAEAGPGDSSAAQDVPPQPPQPKPYDGTCPELQAGTNTFAAYGFDRTVQVFLPPEPAGAPLLYLWHGLGGNAKEIAAGLGAKKAAAAGAIVVSADSCCNSAANKACCTCLLYTSPSPRDS